MKSCLAKSSSVVAVLLLFASLNACVAAAKPSAAASASTATEAAAARLAKSLGLETDDVRPSPIPGMFEIRKQHGFGYISADGRYLIKGDLVDLRTGEHITRKHRRADRLAAIEKLGESSLIVYAPKPPARTRHVVTVFTDMTCPYCRKLHSEISEYNARGIAIRYAFFPRTGPGTASFREAEAIWCSSDRHEALNAAFNGAGRVPAPGSAASCESPIMREYLLGLQLGLRGTPMMILPDGEKVDGYVPPQQLSEELDKASAQTVDPQRADAGAP